jgi:hypothetical protein
MLKREMTYIFSSDPINGAYARSPNGDQFSVNLYNPIQVPRNCKYCTIQLLSANVWYTTPNIAVVYDNDIFVFFDGTTTHTIQIDKGLYDLGALYNALQVKVNNLPAAFLWQDMFIWNGNQATQKVEITFLKPNISINWNLSTVRTILGFDASQTGASVAPFSNYTVTGNNIANFNTFTSYFIRGDLVNDGVPVNSTATGVLANIFIDTIPGSLINYIPQNPPIVFANDLIGARRTQIRFSLTDQRNQPVDTNGEYYAFVLQINYYTDDH